MILLISTLHHYLDIISTPYTPHVGRTRTNPLRGSRVQSHGNGWSLGQWILRELSLGVVDLYGISSRTKARVYEKDLRTNWREEGSQDDQDGEIEDDDWAERHAKTSDRAYVTHIHSFIHAYGYLAGLRV